MTDCPKCTPSYPPDFQSVGQPNRLQRSLADSDLPSSPPPAKDVATIGRYSIRLAEDETLCSFCRRPTGRGPIGYFDDTPICDRCLDAGSFELAAIIALILTTRLMVAEIEKDPKARQESLTRFERFALFFEDVARAWGPARFPDGMPS